jgi:hypothetical protein
MEKDFVKLNEEELKDVVGGVYLNYSDMKKFENLDTAKEASDFLMNHSIRPSDSAFKIYMDKWTAKNGK